MLHPPRRSLFCLSRLGSLVIIGMILTHTLRLDPSENIREDIIRSEATTAIPNNQLHNETIWKPMISSKNVSSVEFSDDANSGLGIPSRSAASTKSSKVDFPSTKIVTKSPPSGIIQENVVSKKTLCNASTRTNSSDLIFTDYTATALVPLRRFMMPDKTPILVQKNASQFPYATCRLMEYQYSTHFAHTMQQLYRCWSFWLQHPTKQHILVTTENKHWKYAMKGEFNRGIMSLIPQLGVQVIDPSNVPFASNYTEKTGKKSVSAWAVGPLWYPKADHFQSPSTNDMALLRNGVFASLGFTSNSSSLGICQERLDNSKRRKPRIAIINRHKTRHILNAQEILEDIRSYFDLTLDISIPELYFEQSSFREQVEALSQVDILITPHGAQETGLVFLPPCGGVVEIMPEKYYYPQFYGTLAATCGLQHAFVHLTRQPHNTTGTTSSSEHQVLEISQRDFPLCPPIAPIRQAVAVLIDKWHKCCDNKVVE